MSRLVLVSCVLVCLTLTSESARAQGFAVQRAEPAAPARPGAPAPREPVRYVMTISGGISLGAYEAGFNWALLRYLKRHRTGAAVPDAEVAPIELVAATGA